MVLQDRLSIPVVAPGRPVGVIARDALPAPLHLARTLLGYRHLTGPERWSAVRTALRLRRLDPDAPELDERSFGEWLAAQGESPGAIEGLWDLIARPTLNLPAADASLALAAMVFRTGLLSDSRAADIGYARVPLAALHAEPAARALRAAGASIHTDAPVVGIARGVDGTVCGVDLDDGHVVADAVVLAVPHGAAAALLPNGAVPDSDRLPELGASPIVNVHVVFDRRVTELELAAGVGTPVQWVFDRTAASGIDEGQCLAVSLSAADEQIGRPSSELSRGIVDALRELFPPARAARVVDTIVTPRGRGDVPGRTRDPPAAAPRSHRGARPVPRRGLDRHRMARHDGGRGAQRHRRGCRGARRPRRRAGGRARGTRSATGAGGGVITATPPVLARARDVAAPAMRAAVATLLPELHGPVQYHFGWADVDGTPVPGGGGKGVRPALAILSAEAAGAPADAGVPGAVALELVHNFSLLHDDVIDNDRERRHRPTVWALFGVGDAIITGDALLTLALEVLFDAEAPGGARAAAALTARDQRHDRRPGPRHDVRDTRRGLPRRVPHHGVRQDRRAARVRRVHRRADGRWRRRVGRCARRIRSPPRPRVPGGRRRPRHLGIAGRDRQAGLERPPPAQKALPIVFAWERATASERRELHDLLANGTPTEPEMARAAALIEAARRSRVHRVVRRPRARRRLPRPRRRRPRRGVRTELVELAHFVVERQS